MQQFMYVLSVRLKGMTRNLGFFVPGCCAQKEKKDSWKYEKDTLKFHGKDRMHIFQVKMTEI